MRLKGNREWLFISPFCSRLSSRPSLVSCLVRSRKSQACELVRGAKRLWLKPNSQGGGEKANLLSQVQRRREDSQAHSRRKKAQFPSKTEVVPIAGSKLEARLGPVLRLGEEDEGERVGENVGYGVGLPTRVGSHADGSFVSGKSNYKQKRRPPQ